MNGTKKAFRLIVVKHKRQAELFDDKPKHIYRVRLDISISIFSGVA